MKISLSLQQQYGPTVTERATAHFKALRTTGIPDPGVVTMTFHKAAQEIEAERAATRFVQIGLVGVGDRVLHMVTTYDPTDARWILWHSGSSHHPARYSSLWRMLDYLKLQPSDAELSDLLELRGDPPITTVPDAAQDQWPRDPEPAAECSSDQYPYAPLPIPVRCDAQWERALEQRIVKRVLETLDKAQQRANATRELRRTPTYQLCEQCDRKTMQRINGAPVCRVCSPMPGDK